MATPASTANYMLGKGILQFDRFDTDGLPTGLKDLGNAPSFTLQPTVETLEHFSSREGIKKKDKVVTLSAGLNIKFTLDEMALSNLALAMMGDVSGDTIALLSNTEINGRLVFTGNNEIGPNFVVDLHKVTIRPVSEVGFISDDWARIEFEGDVEADTEDHPTTPYGTITEIGES